MRFIEFDETKRERAERGVSWVILERVGYRLALQPSSPHTPSNTFLLYLLISFNLITVLIFFLVLFTNNINSNEKQSLFVKWKSLIGMEQKRCGSVGVDCVGGYERRAPYAPFISIPELPLALPFQFIPAQTYSIQRRREEPPNCLFFKS